MPKIGKFIPTRNPDDKEIVVGLMDGRSIIGEYDATKKVLRVVYGVMVGRAQNPQETNMTMIPPLHPMSDMAIHELPLENLSCMVPARKELAQTYRSLTSGIEIADPKIMNQLKNITPFVKK